MTDDTTQPGQIPPGYRLQKIGNSGRPKKTGRDMAITMAYMWRRKFFNEKAEQATEWVLNNWNGPGVSDPAHVRSKLRAIKNMASLYLIVNIDYEDAFLDFRFETGPRDKPGFPKDDPIARHIKDGTVTFLYRATPIDKSDDRVWLWWEGLQEAVIEQTITWPPFDPDVDDPDEVPF